jgi:hypothetical protein
VFVVAVVWSTFTFPNRLSALTNALLQVAGTLEQMLCSLPQPFGQLGHAFPSKRRTLCGLWAHDVPTSTVKQQREEALPPDQTWTSDGSPHRPT